MSGDLADVTGMAFGVRIHGRLPIEFQRYLWSSGTDGHNTARALAVSYQVSRGMPDVEEVWTGQYAVAGVGSRFSLFREPGGFGLKVECQGRGLFHVSPSSVHIEWLPGGTGAAHYFFCHAMPLWLELNGCQVLHASAVAYDDRAVAFLAHSGGGKSTLCHALVQSGAEFLADDGLALSEDEYGNWRCFLGPPVLKLWPSALGQDSKAWVNTLERVHDGFEKRLVPLDRWHSEKSVARARALSAIYVLERQTGNAGELAILSSAARESLIRLIEFSLADSPVTALGLAAERFETVARLARAVGAKRIVYPSGESHWPRIGECIRRDIEGTERDPDTAA